MNLDSNICKDIKFKAYDRLNNKYRSIAELIIRNMGNVIAVRFENDEDITGIRFVDLEFS
mgnify:CR=1 FL=1